MPVAHAANIAFLSSVGRFIMAQTPATCDIEHYVDGKLTGTDLNVGSRRDGSSDMCAQGEEFTLAMGPGYRNKEVVRNVKFGSKKLDKVHVDHPSGLAKSCVARQLEIARAALEGEGASAAALLKLKTTDVRLTDNTNSSVVKDAALSPRTSLARHGRFLIRPVLTSKGACQTLSKDELIAKLIDRVGLSQPEVADKLLTNLYPAKPEEQAPVAKAVDPAPMKIAPDPVVTTETPVAAPAPQVVAEVAAVKFVPAPAAVAPPAYTPKKTGARAIDGSEIVETAPPVAQAEDNEDPFAIMKKHRASDAELNALLDRATGGK